MITAAFPQPLVRHVAGLSGEVPRGDACGDNTALCAAIKAAPASPNVAVDRGSGGSGWHSLVGRRVLHSPGHAAKDV